MVIKPCHNLGFKANYQWAPVGTSGYRCWVKMAFFFMTSPKRWHRKSTKKEKSIFRNKQEIGTQSTELYSMLFYYSSEIGEEEEVVPFVTCSRVGHMPDIEGCKTFENSSKKWPQSWISFPAILPVPFIFRYK